MIHTTNYRKTHYKNRIILLIGLCLVCSISPAKTNKIDSLSWQVANFGQQLAKEQQELELCKKELSICEMSLHSIGEHVDRTNEMISNQISSSSHTISTWGIIFSIISILLTVLGVVFGFYINHMWRKISNLQENAQLLMNDLDQKILEISEQQQRVSANQTEIVNLQNRINIEADQIRQNLEEGEKQLETLQELYGKFKENSSKIYSQLHKEETKRIIERLKEVPEDISNVEGVLLSRSLDETYFNSVYDAYNNLIQRYFEITQLHNVDELRNSTPSFSNKENGYAILFAQHFFRQSIALEDLRNLLRKKFPFLLSCYYKNDAEKSTRDLKIGMRQIDAKLSNEILKEYMLALIQSKYVNYKELYEILLSELNEEQLYDIWTTITEQNSEAYSFAKVFKETIERVNPGSALLNAIVTYINLEKKDAKKI